MTDLSSLGTKIGSTPLGTTKKDVIHEEARVNKLKNSIWNIFYVNPYDLDKNGNPKKFKVGFAKFVVVWSIASQIFLILQIAAIFQAKSTSGNSLASYILYQVSNIIWGYYGYFILQSPNPPIVWSSISAFILVIPILVGFAIYPN